MRITARHYRTGRLVDLQMSDRIDSITPGELPADVELPWVGPGLIDVQVNGYGGVDFDQSEISRDNKWAAIADLLTRRGVTLFLPTFCTNSREGFVAALGRYRCIVEADEQMAHVMPGVHIEGPYISGEDGPRGAHPRRHTRDCDPAEVEEWIEACGGRLRVFTLAPERVGSADLTRALTARGVVVSIAHTAASPEQLDDAVNAGARFSTHLGNGSHTLLNRHQNYLFEQLADDRLWASVIPDGHHVPRPLFRIILRTKGLGRVLLTTDSAGPAGMPPGLYGGSELTPDGRLHLKDRPETLAGSAISLDQGVARAVRMAGIELADAIDLCSLQPARLLGISDRGRLEVGAIADVILFRWDPETFEFDVIDTIIRGRSVHASA